MGEEVRKMGSEERERKKGEKISGERNSGILVKERREGKSFVSDGWSRRRSSSPALPNIL